jgi:hypothetical protein
VPPGAGLAAQAVENRKDGARIDSVGCLTPRFRLADPPDVSDRQSIRENYEQHPTRIGLLEVYIAARQKPLEIDHDLQAVADDEAIRLSLSPWSGLSQRDATSRRSRALGFSGGTVSRFALCVRTAASIAVARCGATIWTSRP